MKRSRRLLAVTLGLTAGASIGTLVLSEVLGLAPCELCWYQRGLLYPQVFILGAALLYPAVPVAGLAIPFSLAGVGVASYHSWLQLQPAPSTTCSISNPCSSVTLEVAGFSIPNLSLLTFLLVLGLLSATLAMEYDILE